MGSYKGFKEQKELATSGFWEDGAFEVMGSPQGPGILGVK